jgi:HEAT repeat protein
MKRLALVLVCVLAAAGCERVSSESIVQWKSTQKGPGKLQDALKDSTVAPRLRAEAAAALVDINMADEVDQALAAIPAADRWEIIKTLIPIHIAGMSSPALPKARASRDALFTVRAYAPPDEQKQIDAVLLPSLEKDLREGRASGGRHSADKMLAAIGPAAAPMLAGLLEDPRVPFQGVVDALERVADPEARERGGVALIKRALASPEIPVALWRALGSVGGKAVTAFLIQKATTGSEAVAVAATQALQQRRDPTLLPMALRIAGDPRANKAVRDEMFGLVEKIGGLEAQRGLVRIIASDPNELVRYRAYEGALQVGRGGAITAALEAFPAKASYKREDVVDYLVKDIAKLGPESRAALQRTLASASPLARMTAVLAYEAPLPSDPKKVVAGPGDAAVVLKLAGDKGTVKGFPPGDTIGKEAARVAAVLQKRVGS